MHATSKAGVDAAKTTSKRVVQKTADATGDLIGNKQLIKLLQQVNQKKNKKQKKQKKFIFHQKKGNKLLMTLDCFECSFIEYKFYFPLYKNEISKNCKFS